MTTARASSRSAPARMSVGSVDNHIIVASPQQLAHPTRHLANGRQRPGGRGRGRQCATSQLDVEPIVGARRRLDRQRP
jgi:hypothetical protein